MILRFFRLLVIRIKPYHKLVIRYRRFEVIVRLNLSKALRGDEC